MIVASLGLLFSLPSQADPIRAGILMGAGVAIGTINKAKCSFADEKFNAMEVKALMLIYPLPLLTKQNQLLKEQN